MSSSLDHFGFREVFQWGRLFATPLEPWIGSLLEPAATQNHAPQLCWIKSDLLGCVWMAGEREGTAGMSVYLSLLPSTSATWTTPQLISQDFDRSEQNPLLFVVDHFLYLIHTSQLARSLDHPESASDGGFSMQWTAKLRIQSLVVSNIDVDTPSTWTASAWSNAINLHESEAFCRNPPFKRVDGSLILPIYCSLQEGGSLGHDHSQVLCLSPNSDSSLRVFTRIDVPGSIGRVHGSIVESKNRNELIQFFRSRLADRIYYSKSDPDGIQWSTPQPSQLPNNNSSIQATRLKSGRLAMIYNRFCFEPDHLNPQDWGDANWPRTRWPLSIALSEDDGMSWPWIRDMDTGFGFCGTGNWNLNGQLAYPCLLEGHSGELHIAYSWAGRTAIRYVFLQEIDIIGFDPESLSC